MTDPRSVQPGAGNPKPKAGSGLGRKRMMASPRNETKTVLLTGPVTLYEASAVRETLRMAMVDGKRLRIDLSDSGPWDLAGLQLLISCVKTAQSRDRPVRLVNVPKECAEIARRSGLAEWLARVAE